MKHTISVPLSERGFDRLIRKLDEYERWMKRKTDQLSLRLASLGATSASIGFATALYDGINNTTITVEHRGDGIYAVKANGETVLIIEYGAGVAMANPPHPEPNGFGPGTYPEQKHAMDPDGWYVPKEKRQYVGHKKSYGSPANAPMYNSVKNLEQEFARIVQEVFAD